METLAFVLAGSLLVVPMASAGAGPCTQEVDNLSKVLIAQDTGSGAGPTAAQLQMGPLPPAMAMRQDEDRDAAQWDSTQNRSAPATSRETTGSAPRASTGEDTQRNLSPKEAIIASHSMAAAMTALERARLLDQQGKESECLRAVGMAKLISGLR